MDEMGFQVPVGHKGQRGVAGTTGPLVKGVVVWSTQGAGPNVSGTELVYAGGLVEAVTITEEEQPTTSACLVIQTTSAINPEFKVTAMCMEWSINHTVGHSQLFTNTMLPVLCGIFQ